MEEAGASLFGIPLHQLALWAAGLVAALWGGSKVPWKAAIARLLAMLPKRGDDSTALTLDLEGDSEEPDLDVMHALLVLHQCAPDAHSHQLVSAVEADYWQKQCSEEPSPPAETINTK